MRLAAFFLSFSGNDILAFLRRALKLCSRLIKLVFHLDAIMDVRIPRNLIHIWGFKDGELSIIAAKNRTHALRTLSSEWSFYLLRPPDIEQLVHRYLPSTLGRAVQTMLNSSRIRWIQKAHVARVVALYSLGGIYCDICDVVLAKPLDDLLSAGLLLCKSARSDAQTETDILGAPPLDARLLPLLRMQLAALDLPKGLTQHATHEVWETTGPALLHKWATKEELQAVDVVERWIPYKGVCLTHQTCARHGETYALIRNGVAPYFRIHHASTRVEVDHRVVAGDLPLAVSVAPPQTFQNLYVQRAMPANSGNDTGLVPVSCVVNLLNKASSLADARLDMLHHIPGSFPEAEFQPIVLLKDIPKQGSKRKLLLRAYASRLPNHRKAAVIGRITKEPNGKMASYLKRLLWQSKGRMSASLKRYCSTRHGGTRKSTKHQGRQL